MMKYTKYLNISYLTSPDMLANLILLGMFSGVVITTLILSPFIIIGTVTGSILWSIQFGTFCAGAIFWLYSHQKLPNRSIEDFYKDIGNFIGSLVSIRPWNVPFAFGGNPMTWMASDNSASEFNYIKNETYSYHFTKLFGFLINTLGAIIVPLLGSLLWFKGAPAKRQTIKRTIPADKQDDKWIKGGNTETWIYVNGIGANFELAKFEAHQLSYIFKRDIELVYNPSYGIFYDISQAIGGRTFEIMIQPTITLELAIKEALTQRNNNKIVIICHSTGSLVAANAIRKLLSDGKPEEKSQIEKSVEIYSFCNMATHLPMIEKGPHYESFSNQQDPMSMLGNSTLPQAEKYTSTSLKGEVVSKMEGKMKPKMFVNKDSNKRGHFFGQHYLADWMDSNYVNQEDNSDISASRLFEYYGRARKCKEVN